MYLHFECIANVIWLKMNSWLKFFEILKYYHDMRIPNRSTTHLLSAINNYHDWNIECREALKQLNISDTYQRQQIGHTNPVVISDLKSQMNNSLLSAKYLSQLVLHSHFYNIETKTNITFFFDVLFVEKFVHGMLS